MKGRVPFEKKKQIQMSLANVLTWDLLVSKHGGAVGTIVMSPLAMTSLSRCLGYIVILRRGSQSKMPKNQWSIGTGKV